MKPGTALSWLTADMPLQERHEANIHKIQLGFRRRLQQVLCPIDRMRTKCVFIETEVAVQFTAGEVGELPGLIGRLLPDPDMLLHGQQHDRRTVVAECVEIVRAGLVARGRADRHGGRADVEGLPAVGHERGAWFEACRLIPVLLDAIRLVSATLQERAEAFGAD